MVGLTNVLLLAGVVCLAAAAPTELHVRQSSASTTSPPWYPARGFFPPPLFVLASFQLGGQLGGFLVADMLGK